MPQYIDSYYLVESRASALVYDFHRDYLKKSKELSDDYPVPQYSDNPERIFDSVDKLLSYLEQNPECKYMVYWESLDQYSEIRQFNLHYTDDGKLIFGVAIIGNEPDSFESILLFKEIKKYLNSSIACITIEEPPPSNSIEFVEFCNNRFVP